MLNIKESKQLSIFLTMIIKIIDYIPEGFESIIYNTSRIIKTSTYIQPPKWLISKKCSINPQNKSGSKCFQYGVTIALYHQQIGKNSERYKKSNPLLTILLGKI